MPISNEEEVTQRPLTLKDLTKNCPLAQFSYVAYTLTQCCTQFKSPGVKILCVLYLHYNVAFSFKCMEIPETKSFIPKGFESGTTLG